MKPVIDIAVEAPGWGALDDPHGLAETAILAAIEDSAVRLAEGVEISIVLCDDAFIAELNKKWRGLDKPTNVLAFPAGGDPSAAAVLGDIVIAFETTAAEANQAGAPLRDRVAHLLVHGFLHLVGYDHVEDADADRMEALETKIAARLGIADPYSERHCGEGC